MTTSYDNSLAMSYENEKARMTPKFYGLNNVKTALLLAMIGKTGEGRKLSPITRFLLCIVLA